LIYNPYSLEGKTILVTGASSGIGKATAIECTKMGANVLITARDKNRLSETFYELEGENNLLCIADLTTQTGIDLLISIAPEIHGIVHCAGLTKLIPFKFANIENFNKVLEVNFYAPTEVTRRLLKEKKLLNESSIVFISSISGVYCSSVCSSIYSASKGAINGLVKGLALDLAPKQIRVNCVNPGVIDTNLLKNGALTDEQLLADKMRYPLKRFGQPIEVAHAAIYLISNTSRWVTGSNLLIDGGFTLL
jgi:NAD(P)-dependent dehydrogenase (short-subunit alcohol dehydrogenase family)